MVLALAGSTALLSAFLDNLTTVLLMVPITFLLADALDIDPIPLVLIEVIASNIGGTATLIGDPPNIMIAGATGLSFVEFLVNLAPIALVTFVVGHGAALPLVPAAAADRPEARDRVMELDARRSIEIREELKRALPVLLGTILLFFVHKPLHLEPATVALLGATVLLLVTTQPLEGALGGIEWPTLFFFIGLFVMVGALEETGAIGEIADGVADLTGGDRTAELLGIAWISAIASGIVDNIPFTATMIPVVEQLQGERDGRRLLVGARAGRLLRWQLHAGRRRRERRRRRDGRARGRPIRFVEFLKVGVPVTLVSLVLATVYMLVRYA